MLKQEPKQSRRIVSRSESDGPNYYRQLHEAARDGDAVMVERLLRQGVGPDKPVFYASPVLLSAVGYGQAKIVRLLIDAHADVNAEDDFGFTPLMSACCYGIGGRPELVKLLLERGANVHAVDFHGHTALGFALEANNTKCIHLLRQAGAKEQQTVLLRASVGDEQA